MGKEEVEGEWEMYWFDFEVNQLEAKLFRSETFTSAPQQTKRLTISIS